MVIVNGQWFFWDTIKSGQFAGIYIVNTDLSQHPCGDISGLISGVNFPGDGGAIPALIIQRELEMQINTHLYRLVIV